MKFNSKIYKHVLPRILVQYVGFEIHYIYPQIYSIVDCVKKNVFATTIVYVMFVILKN